MNENKRNMLLSFYFNFIYLLSLLPFSSNEYVYVISKIGLPGVMNIVMMSVFLYFQSKK